MVDSLRTERSEPSGERSRSADNLCSFVFSENTPFDYTSQRTLGSAQGGVL